MYLRREAWSSPILGHLWHILAPTSPMVLIFGMPGMLANMSMHVYLFWSRCIVAWAVPQTPRINPGRAISSFSDFCSHSPDPAECLRLGSPDTGLVLVVWLRSAVWLDTSGRSGRVVCLVIVISVAQRQLLNASPGLSIKPQRQQAGLSVGTTFGSHVWVVCGWRFF